jgi:hypothetical protein
VTVTEVEAALSDATDILTFTLPEQTGDAAIDAENHTVGIEVANGTDLSILTPAFTLSDGASSNPASGTEGDYSSAVIITVTAEDGTTVQDWTVNVSIASSGLSDATDILTFNITNQVEEAVIDYVNHTISIVVEIGVDLANIIPIFTVSPGATAVPESGKPGDFSVPKGITVTAEDGITKQTWMVYVTEEADGPSSAANIVRFSISEQTSLAELDYANHKIAIEVVNGTDLTNLSPTFSLSTGATSVPESGTTGNYSTEVTITVTAEDGVTVQEWGVNVTEAPAGASDQTDILTFSAPNQTIIPVIDGLNHKITVEVSGGDLTNLTPNWTLSPGATSIPASGTTGNYGSTNPTITVTAEDGVTTQDWIVDVYFQEDNPTGFCDVYFCTEDEAKREACEDQLMNCISNSPVIRRKECLEESIIYCQTE